MKNHLLLFRLIDPLKRGYLLLLVFLFSLNSCLDVIDLDPPKGQEEALVVQGFLLKGSPNRVEVQIARLFNFNTSSFSRVNALTGYIIDETGNRLELERRGEGFLSLNIPDDHPTFRVDYNKSYRVELPMPNGSVIISELEPLIPVTRVDSIHNEMIVKFVPDDMDPDKSVLDTFIRFSVDTQLKLEDQTDYARFRWVGDRTYKVTEILRTGIPSDTCYFTEATNIFQPRVYDGNVLKNDYLSQQVVYDQSYNFKFAEGYVFSVYQESLSEGAFLYWSQIDQLLNRTGDMFETPAGITFSNIRYLDDRDDQLYGYFYCTERDTMRRYIAPTDITPVQSLYCPRFEGDEFLPAVCTECAQLPGSTTTPPPFWITGG